MSGRIQKKDKTKVVIKQKTSKVCKPMGKRSMLEQTPTGMANKTLADAIIPEGHSQRKKGGL